MEWAAGCNGYCNIIIGLRGGKNDSYIKVVLHEKRIKSILNFAQVEGIITKN